MEMRYQLAICMSQTVSQIIVAAFTYDDIRRIADNVYSECRWEIYRELDDGSLEIVTRNFIE